jgi:hypothetical protein
MAGGSGAMVQRRKFRVDQFRADQLRAVAGAPLAPAADTDAVHRHHELILEIRALRSVIEPREHESQRIIDTYQAQIGEIQSSRRSLTSSRQPSPRPSRRLPPCM